MLVAGGIHLFAVEPEWAAVFQELLEKGFGFGTAAGLGERLNQPEGAG